MNKLDSIAPVDTEHHYIWRFAASAGAMHSYSGPPGRPDLIYMSIAMKELLDYFQEEHLSLPLQIQERYIREVRRVSLGHGRFKEIPIAEWRVEHHPLAPLTCVMFTKL